MDKAPLVLCTYVFLHRMDKVDVTGSYRSTLGHHL